MKEYSEDRKSLAQEIRGLLKTRGAWCPDDDGSDLITALGRFAESRDSLADALQTVLASAHPHALEHPAMFAAWKIGEAALKKAGRL